MLTNTRTILQATFTLLPVRLIRAVGCLVRQQRHKGVSRLKGDQLFDIICVGIFVVTVLFLRHLNAGAIYFWIKDLTQEFLKLQVIYTAVELFDKVHFLQHPSATIPETVYQMSRQPGCWYHDRHFPLLQKGHSTKAVCIDEPTFLALSCRCSQGSVSCSCA